MNKEAWCFPPLQVWIPIVLPEKEKGLNPHPNISLFREYRCEITLRIFFFLLRKGSDWEKKKKGKNKTHYRMHMGAKGEQVAVLKPY